MAADSFTIDSKYFEEANFKSETEKDIALQDKYPSPLIITTIAVCRTSDCKGRIGIADGSIPNPHIIQEDCKTAGHIIDYYCVLCRKKIVGASNNTSSKARNNYTNTHRQSPECYLTAKQIRIVPEEQRVDLTLLTEQELFDKLSYIVIPDVLDAHIIKELLDYSKQVKNPLSIFNSSITQINAIEESNIKLIPRHRDHQTKRFLYSLEPDAEETDTGISNSQRNAKQLKQKRHKFTSTITKLVFDKLLSYSFLKSKVEHHRLTALAIIESTPGCQKQAWHRDGIRGLNKYSAVIGLEQGAHICVRDIYDPFVTNIVDIPVGHMVFFKSDLEHSGGAYNETNRRVHMYFTDDSSKEGKHIFCGDKLIHLIEHNEHIAIAIREKKAMRAREMRAAAKASQSMSLPAAPSSAKRKRSARRARAFNN